MATLMQGSNRLQAALAEGRQALGVFQMMPGPNISRLLARTGVDWVVVDQEHGNIDDAQMHECVPAIAAAGVSPIVRLPDMQPWMVKRALDCGAHGIIVPLLRTVEEARDLVQAAKFPPLGRRGFGSPFATQGFAPAPTMLDYLEQSNDALLTMVQIETKEALLAVDQIAEVDGIDGLCIGPFDLANNIGHPILGGIVSSELKEAIARVFTACRRSGKKCGVFSSNGIQAKVFADQGYDMISLTSDYVALEAAIIEQVNMAKGMNKRT